MVTILDPEVTGVALEFESAEVNVILGYAEIGLHSGSSGLGLLLGLTSALSFEDQLGAQVQFGAGSGLEPKSIGIGLEVGSVGTDLEIRYIGASVEAGSLVLDWLLSP